MLVVVMSLRQMKLHTVTEQRAAPHCSCCIVACASFGWCSGLVGRWWGVGEGRQGGLLRQVVVVLHSSSHGCLCAWHCSMSQEGAGGWGRVQGRFGCGGAAGRVSYMAGQGMIRAVGLRAPHLMRHAYDIEHTCFGCCGSASCGVCVCAPCTIPLTFGAGACAVALRRRCAVVCTII
jgi:hypothetical protein